MKRKQLLYGGFILLECVLWGLGNPIIQLAGRIIPPFTSIALRFWLAFAALMLLFGRRVVRGLRGIRALPCLLVCVCTALAFTLGSFALMFTRATTAGFLLGIAVLFTPFLEPLLLKTRFQWRILPVVLVVLFGMYLLCGGEGALVFGLGEWLAVLCSFVFALMLALSEKYIVDMDPIALSTAQCATAGVLSLAFALLLEGVYDVRTLPLSGIAAVVYLALFSTCLAYILQNKAMRHISATYAALAFSTEPLFTALFSYLLLGETLTVQGAIGAAIVLAGVMYASLMRR